MPMGDMSEHSWGRESRVSKPDDELLAPLLPVGEPVEGLLRRAREASAGRN